MKYKIMIDNFLRRNNYISQGMFKSNDNSTYELYINVNFKILIFWDEDYFSVYTVDDKERCSKIKNINSSDLIRYTQIYKLEPSNIIDDILFYDDEQNRYYLGIFHKCFKSDHEESLVEIKNKFPLYELKINEENTEIYYNDKLVFGVEYESFDTIININISDKQLYNDILNYSYPLIIKREQELIEIELEELLINGLYKEDEF